MAKNYSRPSDKTKWIVTAVVALALIACTIATMLAVFSDVFNKNAHGKLETGKLALDDVITGFKVQDVEVDINKILNSLNKEFPDGVDTEHGGNSYEYYIVSSEETEPDEIDHSIFAMQLCGEGDQAFLMVSFMKLDEENGDVYGRAIYNFSDFYIPFEGDIVLAPHAWTLSIESGDICGYKVLNAGDVIDFGFDAEVLLCAKAYNKYLNQLLVPVFATEDADVDEDID